MEKSKHEKKQMILLAGFTLASTASGGSYALMPGETEFRHEEDNHNYIGFFSSEDQMIEEVYADHVEPNLN